MENLLLLHGALGSAATLDALKKELQAQYNVFTLDFSGHGGRPLPEVPLTMDLFAGDILKLLEQEGLKQVHIFGYSMGGYAALHFALHHPESVKSIFTLATKFAWSAEAAAHETKLLDPDKIEQKVPHFARSLAERHAPQDWKKVMHQTAALMRQLGDAPALHEQNLLGLGLPVQVAIGDHDTMVSIEETIWAYRLLPSASLLVLPNTKHPLELVPTARLAYEISQFIGTTTL
ncbi:alpha/beta fold hydrolase [Pontibacter sp. MBLB2868]|uniref:alpha/beta fold hydrolase n=1 Tax=Pontibacter sp. MBLB2868 TaxID=3451555 RepID=UPI003F74B8C7